MRRKLSANQTEIFYYENEETGESVQIVYTKRRPHGIMGGLALPLEYFSAEYYLRKLNSAANEIINGFTAAGLRTIITPNPSVFKGSTSSEEEIPPYNVRILGITHEWKDPFSKESGDKLLTKFNKEVGMMSPVILKVPNK